MSIRGVFQLLKLTVNYSDMCGSSRHLREFMKEGRALHSSFSHLNSSSSDLNLTST